MTKSGISKSKVKGKKGRAPRGKGGKRIPNEQVDSGSGIVSKYDTRKKKGRRVPLKGGSKSKGKLRREGEPWPRPSERKRVDVLQKRKDRETALQGRGLQREFFSSLTQSEA